MYQPGKRKQRPYPRGHRSVHLCIGGFAAVLVLNSAFAAAPVPVDAGSLLRESQSATPAVPPLPRPEVQRKPLEDTGIKLRVVGFVVSGSTRFSATVWDEVLKDFVGQEVGFAGLQAAADRVSLHYRAAGLHATAYLPEQSLANGIVHIVVVEGRFGSMRLESPQNARVPRDLIARMLENGQTRGNIVDVDALERSTLIANDLPGLKVAALLSAGAAPGETDIVATVDARDAMTGSVSIDNFDPRSTGRDKLSGVLSANNLIGLGDQFIVSAQQTRGKQYGLLSYSQPLGVDGWRGGVSVSSLTYRLLDSFAATGGKGTADTWGANLSYPFLRTQELSIIGTLSANRSHLTNDSNVANLSNKVDRSLSFGVNANAYDAFGGGGVTIAGANATWGNVDLSANPGDLAQDAAGPRHNGSYAKLAYNAARLQRLVGDSTAWLSISGQYAFDNLDSTQKMSLGGPNGVRAYPALEASGDHGLVVTAEYRRDFPGQLHGKLFYDWGAVTIDRDAYPGAAARNRYQLKGAGVGIDWNPSPQTTLRGFMAWRIGNNPAAKANGTDSDGTRRIPQLWLSANIDF